MESVEQVWDKVREEVGEFESAEPGSANQAEEFGDVLFSLVNVARKEGIDAEDALLRTCDKFRSRWSVMERLAAQEDAMSLQDATTAQLVGLWKRAKAVLAAADTELE